MAQPASPYRGHWNLGQKTPPAYDLPSKIGELRAIGVRIRVREADRNDTLVTRLE